MLHRCSAPSYLRFGEAGVFAHPASTDNYAAVMLTREAIENLNQLKEESISKGAALQPSGEAASWKGRVKAVLTRSLGKDHHLVSDFDDIRYGLIVASSSTPDSAWDQAFLSGLAEAQGIIDAAIFELGLGATSDDAVDETAFDPDLWAHVQVHVEHEEWQKVASQTAIFVEDRVRRWTGNPKGKDGRTSVGKALFLAAFGDSSSYQLGNEAGESEGWRALGTGFAQALSNVDRHNIQDRDDAKRYAFGVLGLGSLLLTQLRHQHGGTLHRQ